MFRQAVMGLVAFGMMSGLALADDAPKFKTRGIIRASVDRNGKVGGELKKATGIENATSINYKIQLLGTDGSEKIVDPKNHVFRIGEQFRLLLEADSDLYVYVFHEGPDGLRTVLMPDASDNGHVPMVELGKTKAIPDDGTFFEVVEPAGVEKLLVYATPDKKPELTPDAAFDDNAEQKERINLKSAQDKVFKASQENAPVAQTSADIAQVAENVQQVPEFRLRGFRWEPEEDEKAGKTVLVGSYDKNVRPDVFVEITLKSGN